MAKGGAIRGGPGETPKLTGGPTPPTPEQFAEKEARLEAAIHAYIDELRTRGTSSKDARNIASENLRDSDERDWGLLANEVDAVFAYERDVERGATAQESYDKRVQHLGGDQLDRFHRVAEIIGYQFVDPEDAAASPAPAPTSPRPISPPVAPANSTPAPTASAPPATIASMPPTKARRVERGTRAWDDPSIDKILPTLEDANKSGQIDSKLPFWIDPRDKSKAIVKLPSGHTVVAAHSGWVNLGGKDWFWHSGERQFLLKPAFDAAPDTRVKERERTPKETKAEAEARAVEKARAELAQEKLWRDQTMNRIVARRTEIERENAEEAVVENARRAGETAESFSPDLCREILSRDATLKEIVGERDSADVTGKIQRAIRDLANAEPDRLETTAKALRELKTYSDSTHKREMTSLATECAKSGVDLQTFERAMQSERSEALEKLREKIYGGYGFIKRSLRFLTRGLLFSGRAKARELFEKTAPRYRTTEKKLSDLSSSFRSTIEDRLRANLPRNS